MIEVSEFRVLVCDVVSVNQMCSLAVETGEFESLIGWAAVKELKLSYYNKEILLFATYRYHGTLI